MTGYRYPEHNCILQMLFWYLPQKKLARIVAAWYLNRKTLAIEENWRVSILLRLSQTVSFCLPFLKIFNNSCVANSERMYSVMI